MGMRMPPQGEPMPAEGQQAQSGGPAELAGNISSGLEAIAQMVGSQFGEEAGNAIMQLQQQFQQIMMSIGSQGAQPGSDVRSAQEGTAEAVPAGQPGMRQ